MEDKSQVTPSDKVEPSEKPYQTPRLVSYGNIREITKNIGPKGSLDGGGGAGAGPKTGA